MKNSKVDLWTKIENQHKVATFDYCICQRPYHAEHTSSRPITEVKQHWAQSVLGWVTAWEHWVLLASLFLTFNFFLLFLHKNSPHAQSFCCRFFFMEFAASNQMALMTLRQIVLKYSRKNQSILKSFITWPNLVWSGWFLHFWKWQQIRVLTVPSKSSIHPFLT